MLRLITLNLWNYNSFDVRKPRIVKFLRKHNADVVLLQEVRDDHAVNKPGNTQAHQLNDLLKYPYVVYGKALDLNKIDGISGKSRYEGLAILSKYPVTRTVLHKLRKRVDDKFTRHILYCRIKKDAAYDIINVHFTYSPDDHLGKLQLKETLRFAKDKKLKPIIAGDFNMYNPHTVQQIAKDYYTSVDKTVQVTYPEKDAVIDYVLAAEGYRFRMVRAEGRGLSDHLAVIVDIRKEKI